MTPRQFSFVVSIHSPPGITPAVFDSGTKQEDVRFLALTKQEEGMASSCPEVRQRILTGLFLSEVDIVRGTTLTEVKNKLGLGDVSNSQINAALGSLCYKHGCISWSRVWPKDHIAQTKEHVVSLRRPALA